MKNAHNIYFDASRGINLWLYIHEYKVQILNVNQYFTYYRWLVLLLFIFTAYLKLERSVKWKISQPENQQRNIIYETTWVGSLILKDGL